MRASVAIGTVALTALAGTATPIAAPPRDRTLSLHNIHTDETVTVTYKKSGRYVADAMKKINWIMRDWRRNQATTMDPALVDLIWEMHAELGSRQPVNIISGYRSSATNEGLRRSSGGQAKNSRHILGMAADIQFPDVPVRRLRYAALVREKGGVGYYPTSGTPFVHVDTGGVRAWPRLPRHELALLFPDARTRHQPASGGPLTRADANEARSRHRSLALEVAAYHDLRSGRRTTTTAVASLEALQTLKLRQPPQPAERRLAALTPAVPPARPPAPVALPAKPSDPRPPVAATRPPPPAAPAAAPKLVAAPRLVDRPVRLAPRPSEEDRRRMTQLALLASVQPAAPLANLAADAAGRAKTTSGASNSSAAALDQAQPPGGDRWDGTAHQRLAFVSLAAANGLRLAGGWVTAPAFDEDHPEESAYRPFPLAPFLTASASLDDPALTHFVRPDFSRLAELFDTGAAPAMLRLRPGRQVARLVWSQERDGAPAIALSRLGDGREDAGATVALRQVRSEALQR